jgi:hypothetical protein
LGIGPNPQSPIPNPQSPIPIKINLIFKELIIKLILFYLKIFNLYNKNNMMSAPIPVIETPKPNLDFKNKKSFKLASNKNLNYIFSLSYNEK